MAPSEVRLVPIGIYKNFDLDKVREHKSRAKKLRKFLDKKSKEHLWTKPGKAFNVT